MKYLFILFAAVVLIYAAGACKKDSVNPRPAISAPTDSTSNSPDSSSGSSGGSTVNYPPDANAGVDLMVELRVNEGFLNGSCSDFESAITGFGWTKVSGPDSYILGNKNALSTKLSGLEKGIYQFEFMVIDGSGLFDKDTMMVIAGDISSNPRDTVFNDVGWSNGGLLWGSKAEVKNIYNYLPPGSVFRVYLQASHLSDWTELKQLSGNDYYDFFLRDGNLYIYSNFDESTKANIKIVY